MNIHSVDKNIGDREHTVIRKEHAEIRKDKRQGNVPYIANCPGKLHHRRLAGDHGRKGKIMHKRKVESIKNKNQETFINLLYDGVEDLYNTHIIRLSIVYIHVKCLKNESHSILDSIRIIK